MKKLEKTHKETSNKSDELLYLIMKRSLTGFYVVQDGRFQYVNFNAASYAGYTPEELVGKKADVLIHPDDTVQVKKTAREMLRRQRTTPQEFRIFTKKGDVRWVKETVTGILYEGRRTILGSSIDITEYKQAEEALSESRQRLGDIIEFLPDTTFVIDLEGKLIAWNRAAEDLTGMKAKDVLGKGDFHYAQPFWKKRRPMSINLVLKSNRRYEETYDIFTRDRNLVLVEVTVPGIQISERNAYLWGKASPLYDRKGNVVGAIEVIRDITSRKLAEEAIITRERELKIKSHELEEINTALKVLLNQREKDRDEFEEKLLLTVKYLVQPYIDELKKRMIDDKDLAYLNILETNLQNILSPFTRRLSSKYLNLTSREIRIADLIKEGRSSKEIAELLNVSPSAINIYRYRIRKKFGMNNKENLRMYLSSLA
ncbi:MAG TPA: PAS domain S-box protein [Syntrophales bacterium]|nr:PAS domain S-box protein [Syntrophales bacterium]